MTKEELKNHDNNLIADFLQFVNERTGKYDGFSLFELSILAADFDAQREVSDGKQNTGEVGSIFKP